MKDSPILPINPPIYRRIEKGDLEYDRSVETTEIDVDENLAITFSANVCPECGIDHSHNPDFEGVTTSIERMF